MISLGEDMKIKWYGTATLMIECGATRILVDPYLKQYNPRLFPVPVEEASQADAIFITHPHIDHFADIDAFTANGARTVYVSESGIRRARENGLSSDCMTAIAVNERVAVGELTVQTYASRHCVFDAATVLRVVFSPRTYAHARDCIALLRQMKKYRIEPDDIFGLEVVGGGKRVFILGSAGMDGNVEYPQGVDLLVFPYQGRARMHRYMVPFLQTFLPKRVMIDHFDDAFPPLTHTENVKKFTTTVNERFSGMQTLIPREGIWYEI